MTSDPPPYNKYRDRNIPNQKDIRQYQLQGMECPTECHTPVSTQGDLS
jgi:hypothetical protein